MDSDSSMSAVTRTTTTTSATVASATAPTLGPLTVSISPCSSPTTTTTLLLQSTQPQQPWSDVLCANALCSPAVSSSSSSSSTVCGSTTTTTSILISATSLPNKQQEQACSSSLTIPIPVAQGPLIEGPQEIYLAECPSNLNNTIDAASQHPPRNEHHHHVMEDASAVMATNLSSAFDSGRHDNDSSLDDSAMGFVSDVAVVPNASTLSLNTTPDTHQQVSKKPCTLDFYASSGSQSKWYLPPTVTGSSSDVIKINITSDMDTCLMTVSMASIAEPESSIVTPPSEGAAASEQDDDDLMANDKTFPRTNTTNDGISVVGVRNGFPTNLSHQMRAVSSPSLTDMGDHYQRVPSSNSSYTNTSNVTTTTATSQIDCKNAIANNAPTSNSAIVAVPQNVGVLQKFKRTLTNFNKQQSNGAAVTAINQQQPSAVSDNCAGGNLMVTDTEMSTADVTDGTSSNKYRFGHLVWRSSKERRKTKYNRRDKCNSGDSGIQIELENDEQFARALAANGGSLNGSTNGIGGGSSAGLLVGRKQEGLNSLRLRSVRRTNSAKVTSITDQTVSEALNKTKLLKRMYGNGEREAPESLPTRSLSQPNGLESCGMTRNDLDDSDSDSVTSHEEVSSSYYPIYAEVLYNFTAAGPQELGLEKGTLIEILRKEIGPWWFGRIKKEDVSLVEEILDPELGWFPKEFVRVIHSPDTDAFFLRHMVEEEQRQKEQENQLMGHMQINEQPPSLPSALPQSSSSMVNDSQMLNTSSSAPCTPVNTSSEDNCNSTIIDKHNVTTIVIESSSPPPPPSSLCSALLVVDGEHQQQQQHNERDLSEDTTQKQQQDNCTLNTSSTNSTLTTSALTGNGQTILSTSQSLNVLMGSTDILRRSAVKELLDTEVNYVKLLQAICEGYLPAMSKRIDIFSPNSIRLIFSNITAIYKFQRKFLDALRKGIEQNQVGKVFLKMHKGFLCYSTYCNSYPRALIELESYERVKDARTILDNCRESENLAELPLSAHLLAPVQRICRYPLHLAEIIKTSSKGAEPSPFSLHEYELIDVSQLDIPDTTETIDMALEAMKSITEAVNEGKRHSETIARHQASFQNFKGPPLHLHSSRFFVQIDATRQKQNLWNSSCTLFLFDNQLVYCKRDIIKRSHFIYKGRIFLDRCRVVNVRDGKMFGHTIKNSLRIYCEARDKCYDFSFRSANRKQRFLNTLALERQFSGKALYISEIPGLEYAFEERDYSDQSDYEGAENEQQRLKEFLYEANLNSALGNGNQTNTSGESSVPESPAKSFKYSDTLPKKSTQRLEATTATTTTTMATNHNEGQTTGGSLGRRRLGNWFRKPKSSASTPNQSPTHKHTHPPAAHSTGDLQLAGTEMGETYTVLEHAENGGVSS
ncbi:serine-rich adhesin for platelets isoform X2 [Stomoxys calcitrans]|uniref:serine-rich adhesin for platelets isoform X2 n=1 Tax=Stomoxys calcitrans TaxID=35570 RepID=UPI0027E2B1DE|nr:serine-rich adhesin for platelets isoform X2 [Stomoxys calcitrans]